MEDQQSIKNIDRNYIGHGIYRENILDNYKNPRNLGRIENADAEFRDFNPVCGDELSIGIKFNSHAINDVKIIPRGCAISVASASILSEFIKGKTKDEIKNLKNEDVFNMLGIELSPIRVKCALLPLVTLKKAVYGFDKIKYTENGE